MSQDPALVELLAKQAITEQIYRYCRAMDRIDNDLGKTVWHGDGLADYGPIFRGKGNEYVEWVENQHLATVDRSHQVSNILIEVRGESATSEAYVTAALRRRSDDGKLTQLTIRGRYLDRWSRRDGRWAIDERRYAHDFDDIRDITEVLFVGWGARDRSDLLYSLIAG